MYENGIQEEADEDDGNREDGARGDDGEDDNQHGGTEKDNNGIDREAKRRMEEADNERKARISPIEINVLEAVEVCRNGIIVPHFFLLHIDRRAYCLYERKHNSKFEMNI